eukprot:Partr_v1_DN27603_c3_g1_i2_m65322 putative ATPase, class VI, type
MSITSDDYSAKGSFAFPPASDNARLIYMNLQPPDEYTERHMAQCKHYSPNVIRTRKYNIISFIPKNLFEQFRRIANFYFLALVLLGAVPEFGVTSPILGAVPIVLIVLVTAAKDGFEDWKRHLSDDEINNSLCRVSFTYRNCNIYTHRPGIRQLLQSFAMKAINVVVVQPVKFLLSHDGVMENSSSTQELNIRVEMMTSQSVSSMSDEWRARMWKDLRVGDLMMIRNNEPIPADILVLSTSEPDSICYVETKNLDGETNLKIRNGPAGISLSDSFCHVKCRIDTEYPTENLYQFNGTMHLLIQSKNGVSEAVTSVPLTINEVLLRGCTLRNTEWIIGVVLFTGSETKLIMNSGHTPSKRSRIEREMNIQVMLNFGILMTLCTAIAFGQLYFYISRSNSTGGPPFVQKPFLTEEEIPSYFSVWIFSFCTSLIILQNIVPISLYVTTELVKSFQVCFIHRDHNLIDIRRLILYIR